MKSKVNIFWKKQTPILVFTSLAIVSNHTKRGYNNEILASEELDKFV